MLSRKTRTLAPFVVGISIAVIASANGRGQSAAEPKTDVPTDELTHFDPKDAVGRAVASIETSMAVYREERSCFSCHHHAHSVVALSEIAKRGFDIDQDNLNLAVEDTIGESVDRRDRYTRFDHIGGGIDTVANALIVMKRGGHQPDETTRAMVEWILNRDSDKSLWTGTTNRPPTQTSDLTRTWLCIEALRHFGPKDQQSRIEKRLEAARKGLLESAAETTEDRVAQIRGLHALGGEEDKIAELADQLIDEQREDGGWAQKPEMESDAYATATVLLALHLSAGIKTSCDVYQRGVHYLLETQRPDGTWRVKTRATPVQVYFESGFPHGKDQFISMTTTCWAATAIALTIPET